MDYTLISSLGTGMFKKEGGYRKTTYFFSEDNEISSQLFLNAVLESKFWNIKKIILVGTRTSSWDVLIDETKYEDLWLAVKEECEGAGITDENLEKIRTIISEEKQLECCFKVHTSKVDFDSVQEIFNVYNTIAKEIHPKTKILFDITHGFRSMPILIYQALQFESSKNTITNLDLIYGEYVDEQKKSFVRNLSKYWELSEITSAMNEFKTKFDGRTLASKLENQWEKGAKVLNRLSEIVSLNFSLQIWDLLRQLKNTLAEDVSDKPEWVKNVKDELQIIHKKLNKEQVSSTLFEYAVLLEEKRLYTQAVIALQVCVETIVAEHDGLNYEQLGDYEWMQNYGKNTLYNLLGKLSKENRESIKNIEYFRNQIDHGGAKDKKTETFPSASNLRNILANGKNSVKELMDIAKDY